MLVPKGLAALAGNLDPERSRLAQAGLAGQARAGPRVEGAIETVLLLVLEEESAARPWLT